MTEESTTEARPKRAYGEGRLFYRANRGVGASHTTRTAKRSAKPSAPMRTPHASGSSAS